jgi:hypothetical protein
MNCDNNRAPLKKQVPDNFLKASVFKSQGDRALFNGRKSAITIKRFFVALQARGCRMLRY